jgi:hypothetical protein
LGEPADLDRQLVQLAHRQSSVSSGPER